MPGWEGALNLLNQRHEVLAIRLWDPREIELPDIGPVIMEERRLVSSLYVDTHDKNVEPDSKQQRSTAN